MHYIAHLSEDGRKQQIAQHAQGTAKRAEEASDQFGAGPWGRQAALAHDIGKYSTAFQTYIRGDERHEKRALY